MTRTSTRAVRPALLLLALAAILAAALSAACGGGSPSPSASATATSPAPSAAAQEFYLAAATGAKAGALSTISDGGAATTVARSLGPIVQIAWSPDGRRLACIAGRWPRQNLFVADPAAKSITEVRISAPSVQAVDSVAWLSADELLVAGFSALPQDTSEVAELVVYDVASGEAARLSGADDLPLRGVMVSASADGAKVAFVTYTNVRRTSGFVVGTERLKLLDRSSGAVTELGTGKAYFDVNGRRFDDPLISPDGGAVIFRSARSDVGTSYTVIDAAGTILMAERELLFPAGYAWDPTGQRVVFSGRATDAASMDDPVTFYVFDRRVGGAAESIARLRGLAIQELSWSPDGTTIAFAAWDAETYETGSLYELPVAGGAPTLLVDNALYPAYQPLPGRTPAAP